MSRAEYSQHWHICDEYICLFNGATVPRHNRCIKHGALIEFLGYRYDGLTREQVRKTLKARLSK